MNEINGSQIKLSQLRTLVAVAEFGNFSEAALHLELSQSAVSHAIASLEEELGVVLLSRGRHGAHPTPVGERVISHARQVLQLIEAVVKEANLEKGLHGGSVRIACYRSVATHVLPAAITRFRSHFPEIAVTISEHFDHIGVEQALREGRADIGFTILPSSDEFETWEIMRDEYVVLLPPTHGRQGVADAAPGGCLQGNVGSEVSSPQRPPKLKKAQITWEQLASYPLICPSQARSCSIPIHNHLLALGIPLKVSYEVNEDSTIVSMVVQGLGAAIIARLAAEPIPATVQVCSLPVPLERVIGVAVLADALQTPGVFAFLDTLKGAARFPIKTAV